MCLLACCFPFCPQQDKATSTDPELDVLEEDKGESQELFSTPSSSKRHKVDGEANEGSSTSGGSTSSLESIYVDDPDAPEGVIAQSQPCYKRGIHYTPLGLKKVYRKKRKGRKLFHRNDDEEKNN